AVMGICAPRGPVRRPARPASRGCSNFGPGIGGGRWVLDVAVDIADGRGMRRCASSRWSS
ncbi:MAG TPA: hypothetical protein VL002_03865, partial [Candidimonas sp.]|nr:hypothetical protein [Candidimonas sp.]